MPDNRFPVHPENSSRTQTDLALRNAGTPTEAEVTARYRAFLVAATTDNTRRTYRSALSQWHIHQGFADPAATPAVRKTLTGITRIYGKPKKKAKALLVEDMERIVMQLMCLDTLKAKRDNALCRLVFSGAIDVVN